MRIHELFDRFFNAVRYNIFHNLANICEGARKNAGLKNARGGKCWTEKCGTENAWVENAGPENAGLKMRDWKM